MSTMEQARPADVAPDTADLGAAVEEQMTKIVTELGAALGVLLTSLGTRSGLWAALAGAGPLTTARWPRRSAWNRRWYGSGCAPRPPAGTWTTTRHRDRSPCPTRSRPPSATAPAGRSSTRRPPCCPRWARVSPSFSEAFSSRAGLRVASAHRRPLARHGRLHQGRPARRPDRGRDRRDGRRGGGPDAPAARSRTSAAATARRPWPSPGQYPAARVLGIDYHDASIAARPGRGRRGRGVANVRFEVAAAADLPGQRL